MRKDIVESRANAKYSHDARSNLRGHQIGIPIERIRFAICSDVNKRISLDSMLAMFVCSQTVIANDDVSVEFGLTSMDAIKGCTPR